MDADQPGLFQLPEPEPQVRPERTRRGRNREVWELTATAEVTITDASALQAAARSNEGFVITVPGADLSVQDAEPEPPDAAQAPGDDVFDALAWLIWPSDGLEGALKAGALRILSVESEAKSDSVDHGTATWRVTAKLTDMEALRRLAARASPEEAAEISASLASLAAGLRPVCADALDRRNHLDAGASRRRAPPCQGWPEPLKPRRVGLPLRGRKRPDPFAAEGRGL